MALDMADIGNVLPRNVRVAGFKLQCQVTAGFRHDLDTLLLEPLLFQIGLERIKVEVTQYMPDAFNRFDDIGQARNQRTRGHQKIRKGDASIRCRSAL